MVERRRGWIAALAQPIQGVVSEFHHHATGVCLFGEVAGGIVGEGGGAAVRADAFSKVT
ncbi:hypothetical protein D3C80_1992190 [compost metagenome]